MTHSSIASPDAEVEFTWHPLSTHWLGTPLSKQHLSKGVSIKKDKEIVVKIKGNIDTLYPEFFKAVNLHSFSGALASAHLSKMEK